MALVGWQSFRGEWKRTAAAARKRDRERQEVKHWERERESTKEEGHRPKQYIKITLNQGQEDTQSSQFHNSIVNVQWLLREVNK